MTEEAVETQFPPDGDSPPPHKIVLDMPSWVPAEKLPGWLLVMIVVIAVVVVSTGTALPFALGWLDQGDFQTLGYAGIFLANFFGTATGFIPVPGLTAGGQALIIAGSDSLFKPGVVVAGASGMTLAESTAYLTGVVGRGVAEERQMPLKGRLGRWMRRGGRGGGWGGMDHWVRPRRHLSARAHPLFAVARTSA